MNSKAKGKIDVKVHSGPREQKPSEQHEGFSVRKTGLAAEKSILFLNFGKGLGHDFGLANLLVFTKFLIPLFFEVGSFQFC